jgi:hypothetical protein
VGETRCRSYIRSGELCIGAAEFSGVRGGLCTTELVLRMGWRETFEISEVFKVHLEYPDTFQDCAGRCTNVYIMHPLLLLECKSVTPNRTRWPPIVIKLSTSHSYHTLRSSVWRQKLTSTSEFAGSWIGS